MFFIAFDACLFRKVIATAITGNKDIFLLLVCFRVNLGNVDITRGYSLGGGVT